MQIEQKYEMHYIKLKYEKLTMYMCICSLLLHIYYDFLTIYV
jgi:hypothetical protein